MTSVRRRAAVLVALFLALPATAQRKRGAPFDAPVVVAPAVSSMTDLLDLDGDGSLEPIGFLGRRIDAWRNDGAGEFIHAFGFDPPELDSGLVITQLRVGRLDADDRDDFAFSHFKTVTGYVTHGVAAPTPLFDHLGSFAVGDFELADFDGDGIDDVIAVLHRSSENVVKLYRNDGVGSLVLLDEKRFAASSNPVGLFVAELNGDGRPDFGFVNDSQILLFRLVALAIPEPLALPRTMTTYRFASGDVDGDGDVDLVAFGHLGASVPQYEVFRRTAPDGFEREAPLPGSLATALVDVDGDGDLDAVGADGAEARRPNLRGSSFRIALNDGTGAFGAAMVLAGLGATRLAGAADVDHDGDVDLVAGRCAYYAHGPLAAFGRPAIPYVGFPPPIPRAPVDADSDGDLDAEFSLEQTADNRGDGTFVSRVPVRLDAHAGLTLVGPGIAGDFDGDGDPDLLVEARDAAGAFVETRLLRNIGCGAFADGGAAAPPFENPCFAPNLAVDPSLAISIDLDGDGDLDVVAQDGVRVPFRTRPWLNDGSGFLVPAQDLGDERLKGVADLDGDAIPDIVLRTVNPDAPGVRLGLGDGTFGPIGRRIDGLRVDFAIAIADFDRDGDADVIGLSTVERAPFAIFRNGGSANFTPSFPLGFDFSAETSAGAAPIVVPTDFNGDGRLDLVVRAPTSIGTHPLSALFAAEEDGLNYVPPVFQVFWASRAADVDGDGDEDLIQAKFTLGSASDTTVIQADRVVRCRRVEPPASGVRRQYGDGTAGAGGIVPVLGVAGPNLVPGVRPELRLRGALGGSRAILLIGRREASESARGGTLLVDETWRRKFRLDGARGAAGAGAFTFASRPLADRRAGRTLFFQALVLDAAAPGGFAFSNGLAVTVGSDE